MILILVTITFVLLRVAPSDPVRVMLGGRNVSQELLKQKRKEFGFDRPLHIQYYEYMRQVVTGSFGDSLRTGRPVIKDIFLKFPATIELAIFSMMIAIVLGLATGTQAAVHADKALDHGIRMFNIGAFSTPIFWMGMMFQLFFGVILNVLPVTGRLSSINSAFFDPMTRMYVLDSILQLDLAVLIDSLKHLALPSLTLGLILSGLQGRMTRSSMLEVLDQEYVTAARAKGLTEQQVNYQHALRNALIPIITTMGMQFALLFAGAALTETTFSWPGIARYLILSIEARDYPAIQGTIVFIAIFISTVNLIVDVINAQLDPKVRY
mgnify:CR=1 FL=1